MQPVFAQKLKSFFLSLLLLFTLALFTGSICSASPPPMPATPDHVIVAHMRDGVFDYAKEDGVTFYRSAEDVLCRREGDSVTPMKRRFYGNYLFAEDGVIYYTDAVQDGLFAFDTGYRTEYKLVDFEKLPGFPEDAAPSWWTEDGQYYFLTGETLWIAGENGELLERMVFPWEDMDILCVTNGRVVYRNMHYAVSAGVMVRGLYVYNFRTGITLPLDSFDPETDLPADGNAYLPFDIPG